MKEKWFVIVLLLQFAILLVVCVLIQITELPWLKPNRNGLVDVVTLWTLAIITTPLFLYLAFRLCLRAIAYMGASWAGEAEPARLRRDQQWHTILVGVVLGVFSLDLWDQGPFGRVIVAFASIFSLMCILWGVDEMRRSRAEPPDAQPPSEA